MTNWGRVAARWVTMQALGLWLGGILFLGAVSAPAIFKFCRANKAEILAPQLVGALVERFAPLSIILGIMLLVSWLAEAIWVFGKHASRIALKKQLWMAQGLCLVGMLVLAVYLRYAALPELIHDQAAVIHESLANHTSLTVASDAAKSAVRVRFDTLHERYSNLTMVIFWLGAATMLTIVWRLSIHEKEHHHSRH